MEEFKLRREKILAKLAPNSVAILPAATIKLRNNDTEYFFRQDSDFYYLTGFEEPDAYLVLVKTQLQGQAQLNTSSKAILFCLPKDEVAETWTGKRIGVEGAVRDYGFDAAYGLAEIETKLIDLLKDKAKLYYPFNAEDRVISLVNSWLKKAKAKHSKNRKAVVPDKLGDLTSLIYEMRLHKTKSEIANLRKAAEITAEAHRDLMQLSKPGMSERQLEAEFIYRVMQKGCRAMSYPAIVASGENACTLHYTKNDSTLRASDLVLVDAGGEYNYYAADVTRTFPVSGKFSSGQRDIYNLVLAAQLKGIKEVYPGNCWGRVQEVIVDTLVKGLLALGILSGGKEWLLAEGEYKRFYMHSSGHWLGLDVHDVGSYYKDGVDRKFQPGMTLTVEPGLYLSGSDSKLAKKWRGIGIRIEDDILVTENGNEVLTAAAPKTVEEIEELMNSNQVSETQ